MYLLLMLIYVLTLWRKHWYFGFEHWWWEWQRFNWHLNMMQLQHFCNTF